MSSSLSVPLSTSSSVPSSASLLVSPSVPLLPDNLLIDALLPDVLLPGAKVGIVAPSGYFDPAKIERALQLIEERGWVPVKSRSLYHKSGIYAGTDSERAEDLICMLEDPSISALFCARGGYGAMRLLPYLEMAEPSHPKWIIGYSDITALHRFARERWGWASVHGPLLVNAASAEPFAEQSFGKLLDLLSNEPEEYVFKKSASEEHAFKDHFSDVPDLSDSILQDSIEGELIGGNLSVLYALRGTPYDFNPEGKILFIEDIGEYLYHLDRMLVNFSLGGKFNNLAGIITGDFTGMKDGSLVYGKTAQKILEEHFSSLSCPVFYGFPGGHNALNIPLIMGRKVSIRTILQGRGGAVLSYSE